MLRRSFPLLWVLLFLLSVLSAASAEGAPLRVLSLYGSYAEAWLEAGGTLIGVTSDAIEERGLSLSEDVTIIGTTKAPNLEAIIALDPDLVIYSLDIAAQAVAADTLSDAGIHCEGYRVDSYQDYADMMRAFTDWTGRKDLYDAIIPPMQAQILHLISQYADTPAPSALLLRAYSTGVKAKNADNLAGIILRDLHVDNIADRHASLLEDLTLEAIVAEDPDFIFVSIMGSDEDAALNALDASIGSNPAWQELTAVREGRFYILPKDLFHYKPNARWGESYAYLAEILYGEDAAE